MRLVKLLSRGEGIRTLLWTFIKSFQVATSAEALAEGDLRFSWAAGLQGAPPPQLPRAP